MSASNRDPADVLVEVGESALDVRMTAFLSQPSDQPRNEDITDDGLAVEFATAYADRLRWVQPWGKWLRWTGTHWQHDEVLYAFDQVRRFLRDIARFEEEERAQILHGSRIASVERLAKSDPRIAATSNAWDADPEKLNTPAGTVDLRTGAIAPHSPDDLLTKITAAGPDGDCPRWRQFLDEVTDGDRELAAYLQRLAGYAATGLTVEHMFGFCHGSGRNGKGVFLNTLTDVMGGYAMTSGADVFTASKHERHPTELAALRGARLVVAQEIEDGRAWAEARIKALTGGDPIQARYMRQDFFTFEPEFTLLIAGNHKPRLSNVDPAMRARLHLIPFTVTIPKDKRDPRLREKLRDEWSGIMAWVVEGARLYFEHGLQPPAAVHDATDDYFAAQDHHAEFLEERCDLGPDFWELAGTFRNAWRDYCRANGCDAGTDAEIREKFAPHGIRYYRDKRARRYLGVRISPEHARQDDDPRAR